MQECSTVLPHEMLVYVLECVVFNAHRGRGRLLPRAQVPDLVLGRRQTLNSFPSKEGEIWRWGRVGGVLRRMRGSEAAGTAVYEEL